MGTKNNPGEFDCYDDADPDEPRFVILGRDIHGGEAVRRWAISYYRSCRRRNGARKMSEHQLRKYKEARACADAMDKWRAAHQ